MDEKLTQDLNEVMSIFDKWTDYINLPNKTKPLKEITSEEYLNSLQTFFDMLDNEDNISFRKWIESFYAKNEIDFDYLYLMTWDNWFKLYFKVFQKYIDVILKMVDR